MKNYKETRKDMLLLHSMKALVNSFNFQVWSMNSHEMRQNIKLIIVSKRFTTILKTNLWSSQTKKIIMCASYIQNPARCKVICFVCIANVGNLFCIFFVSFLKYIKRKECLYTSLMMMLLRVVLSIHSHPAFIIMIWCFSSCLLFA